MGTESFAKQSKKQQSLAEGMDEQHDVQTGRHESEHHRSGYDEEISFFNGLTEFSHDDIVKLKQLLSKNLHETNPGDPRFEIRPAIQKMEIELDDAHSTEGAIQSLLGRHNQKYVFSDGSQLEAQYQFDLKDYLVTFRAGGENSEERQCQMSEMFSQDQLRDFYSRWEALYGRKLADGEGRWWDYPSDGDLLGEYITQRMSKSEIKNASGETAFARRTAAVSFEDETPVYTLEANDNPSAGFFLDELERISRNRTSSTEGQDGDNSLRARVQMTTRLVSREDGEIFGYSEKPKNTLGARLADDAQNSPK